MLILQLAFAMELLAKLTTLLSAALSGLKIATGDQRDYDRFSAMKSEYDLPHVCSGYSIKHERRATICQRHPAVSIAEVAVMGCICRVGIGIVCFR